MMFFFTANRKRQAKKRATQLSERTLIWKVSLHKHTSVFAEKPLQVYHKNMKLSLMRKLTLSKTKALQDYHTLPYEYLPHS
jgi:hypothetical protein